MYYVTMTTITINECVYNVHPIFDLYAANKKPYGFIDGAFIPQDTQSKKSEYTESA